MDTALAALHERFWHVGGFVALFLSSLLIAWLIIDAKRRERRWMPWVLLSWFISFFVIIPWLVTRRRSRATVTIGRSRALRVWGLSILISAGYMTVGTLTVTFLFQVARVEGQAMAPTLRDQDRLIVNKLVYLFDEPQIGDIVMHRYPINPERSFVKRVIGREGDRVQIVRGTVLRNGRPVDDAYVPQEFRSHDDWGPEVIPEQHFFLLGDHRNNSADSRHWGYVSRAQILGRVRHRWYPSIGRVF